MNSTRIKQVLPQKIRAILDECTTTVFVLNAFNSISFGHPIWQTKTVVPAGFANHSTNFHSHQPKFHILINIINQEAEQMKSKTQAYQHYRCEEMKNQSLSQ